MDGQTADCASQHQSDAIVGQPMRQRCTEAHVSEANHRLQVMQGHPLPRLLLDFHAQGVVVQSQPTVG